YDPRALLESQRLPNEPPAQGAAAGGTPTNEAEYWAQRWQYELAEQEAARAQRAREFEATRADQAQAAVFQRFGQYAPSTPVGQGGGIAQQQAAARQALDAQLAEAQAARDPLG